MKRIPMSAPYLISSLLLIIFGVLSVYQNCAPFRPNTDHSHLSSSAAVAACESSEESTSCELETGTLGLQSCTETESGMRWSACVFDRCLEGYFQSGNICLPQLCSPGQNQACTLPGGSGTQVCSENGSSLSACVANQCDSGFYLQDGACLSNLCQPGSSMSCAVANGVGTRSCLLNGSGYSSCLVQQCNPGYYLAGTICRIQLCQPGSSQACTMGGSQGSQVCNSTGSAFESCVISSCPVGYSLVNGACEQNLICTPGMMRPCTIANGSGSQTCAASGLLWNNCTVTACHSGYSQNGNTCTATNLCLSGQTTTCAVPNGSGVQRCQSTPSGGTNWSGCQLASCNFGYTPVNGICTLVNSTIVTSVSLSFPVDRSFYRKQLIVNGFPILASQQVRDQALYQARAIMLGMLESSPEYWPRLVNPSAGFSFFAIIGENEETTDIPEYRNLYTLYPGINWNAHRGLGGVIGRPVTSAAEENILCLASNRWHQSSILVHEMSHHLMNIAIQVTDPTKYAEIQSAFNSASNRGLWSNTYSRTNSAEYFAQGAGAWFDALPSYIPAAGDGVYNHIWNRLQIMSYDSGLSNVLSSIYRQPAYRWAPRCP